MNAHTAENDAPSGARGCDRCGRPIRGGNACWYCDNPPGSSAIAIEQLARARAALIQTGYFTSDQVGDDIAPRITELYLALTGPPHTCYMPGDPWCRARHEGGRACVIPPGETRP